MLWLTRTKRTQVGHDWPPTLLAKRFHPLLSLEQALEGVLGEHVLGNGAQQRIRNTARALPLSEEHEDIAATLRPTEPQRRYLERGLSEPGGKLPLFDRDGREVAPRTKA